MVKKKATTKKATTKKATTKKATTKKATTKKSRSSKATKSKSKKTNDVSLDSGIVIVDDDIAIDKDIVNEERRAYLEEARSQDAAE